MTTTPLTTPEATDDENLEQAAARLIRERGRDAEKRVLMQRLDLRLRAMAKQERRG